MHCHLAWQTRPDFGGNSGGGRKKLGCSGLAHDPHGKLGLTVERAKVNDVTHACCVHMYQCINEL
jgi:hypothetical protein